MPDATLRLMAYGPDKLEERQLADAAELAALPDQPVVWIDLDGTADPVLEQHGERLEDLETAVVESPMPRTLAAVHAVKRDLLHIRRAVWPLREALSNLGRADSPLVQPATRAYLRDVHDRTVQVMDLV